MKSKVQQFQLIYLNFSKYNFARRINPAIKVNSTPILGRYLQYSMLVGPHNREWEVLVKAPDLLPIHHSLHYNA